MGLLPVIAQGVHASIPATGMLITAYAIGVMLGAPLMTILLSHWPRRRALIVLMSIFTVGNLLSAVSTDYTTLLLARLVTSLNHGAFFGLGSLVAASVVPRHKQASAVATMFMGLTIANIGGVPAATWLGQAIGWRMSFAATAVLGLITMLTLRLACPRRGRTSTASSTGAEGTKPPGSPDGHGHDGAGFRRHVYALHLYCADAATADRCHTGLCHGHAGAGGNRFLDWQSGWWPTGRPHAQRQPDRFLTLLVAIMLAFPQLAQSHGGAAFAIVVWGIATFAVVPPLQMRVMRAAAEAPAWPPRSMSVPSIWVMRWGQLPVVPPSPPGLAMALCRLSVP
jgi:DHA1 family inner membrane transport protein